MATGNPEMFEPKGPAAPVGPTTQELVAASKSRLLTFTRDTATGERTSLYVQPYKQRNPSACFFSGPIIVGTQFHGRRDIEELEIAREALQIGLMQPGGALHSDPRMPQFLRDRTSVDVRIGEAHEVSKRQYADEAIVGEIDRGNVVMMLYPLTDRKQEWGLAYAFNRTGDGVRVSYNHSPDGSLREADLSQLLYGHPVNRSRIELCVIAVQGFYDAIPPSTPDIPFQPMDRLFTPTRTIRPG